MMVVWFIRYPLRHFSHFIISFVYTYQIINSFVNSFSISFIHSFMQPKYLSDAVSAPLCRNAHIRQFHTQIYLNS